MRLLTVCFQGKTYQCAALIEHVKTNDSTSQGVDQSELVESSIDNVATVPSPPVLFAFLRHDTALKRTRTAILHSFIFQLFHENRALLPVVLAAHKSEPRKMLTSTDYLCRLLKDMIRNIDVGLTYIIIDGLDECEESERHMILKTALELSKDCPTLRLAIASRDEKDISRILKNVAQLILVNTQNDADISWYISSQLDELSRDIQPATPIRGTKQFINALKEPLVHKANGTILPTQSASSFTNG